MIARIVADGDELPDQWPDLYISGSGSMAPRVLRIGPRVLRILELSRSDLTDVHMPGPLVHSEESRIRTRRQFKGRGTRVRLCLFGLDVASSSKNSGNSGTTRLWHSFYVRSSFRQSRRLRSAESARSLFTSLLEYDLVKFGWTPDETVPPSTSVGSGNLELMGSDIRTTCLEPRICNLEAVAMSGTAMDKQ